MSDRYTLEGTAVSPPDGPLANTRIEAFDADSGPDDLLGTADTVGDGRFELAFDVESIGGPEEGVPEVYVRVLDADTDPHTEAVTLSDTTTSVARSTSRQCDRRTRTESMPARRAAITSLSLSPT